MPVFLAGQISDPPIWNNAVLAAALSALLVSLANLWINHKKNDEDLYKRRQQAYCMLKGRNSVVAEFYSSYATAFIKFNIQRAIRHRIGIPSDPLYYHDNERQMKLADMYSKEVDIEYGKLLETLCTILLLFTNKDQMVDKIQELNRKFLENRKKCILERYYPGVIERCIRQLDPPIIIDEGVVPSDNKLSPKQTQQMIEMENKIMSWIEKDIESEIEKCIRGPVNELLESIMHDLSQEHVPLKKKITNAHHTTTRSRDAV